MDLIAQLRAETRPAHDRIEQLPAARAMASGAITRAAYAAVLDQLYWVHSAFETEVRRCPEIAAVWPAEAVRAGAAGRDLAALGAAPNRLPPEVAGWQAELSAGGAAALAGAGYVLEGSRFGGRVLVGPLARALGIPDGDGAGLDFHREGLADPGGRWTRVRAALSALDRTPADRATLVAAAVATFDLMSQLMAGSGPARAVAHPGPSFAEPAVAAPTGGVL